MVKPELAEYIRKNKEIGKSVNDTRLELLNAGWDDLDIEQTFAFVTEASQRAQTAIRMLDSDKTLGVAMTQKSIWRSVLISSVFLVLVGGGIASLVYFMPSKLNMLLDKTREQISRFPSISKFLSSEKFEKYASADVGFGLSYPSGWAISTSTEEISHFVMFGSTKDSFDLPIPKDQAVVYVELAYGSPDQVKQVISYSKSVFEDYNKSSDSKIEFSYTEPQKTKLGNYEAIKIEYDTKSVKLESEMITGHIVQYLISNPYVPNSYYKISLHTDTKSEKFEKIFEKIASSFEIKDTVKWKKHKDKNGVFSMDYPPLWTAKQIENEEHGMIAAFYAPEDYTGLKTVIVSISVIPPDPLVKYSTIPLSYFADSVLKKTSTGSKVIGKPTLSDVVFGGYKGKMISSSTKNDLGIPLLVRQILFLSGEKLMLVSIAKNPDNLDFDNDLEKMFTSFSM